MKYFVILVLLLLSCKNKNANSINDGIQRENIASSSTDSTAIKSRLEFLDSLYSCECNEFISKIEEIPNTDTNAYRITIKSKDSNWEKSKLIDTRPGMSRIKCCNEFYTIVSFACGGPCHSEVFVFTNEDKPDEQYGYAQLVKNNPNIIGHIRNEEFENLVIYNLENKREMVVDISEYSLFNYGRMDSIVMKKNNITLYSITENEKIQSKTINIKSIL